MTATVLQPQEFLAAVYGGMLLGLLYDGFRLLRLPFPRGKWWAAAFDLIYYAAAGGLSALMLLYLCGGELRAYHAFGLFGGAMAQQWFLSRPVRKAFARAVKSLQKNFGKKAGIPERKANMGKE